MMFLSLASTLTAQGHPCIINRTLNLRELAIPSYFALLTMRFCKLLYNFLMHDYLASL